MQLFYSLNCDYRVYTCKKKKNMYKVEVLKTVLHFIYGSTQGILAIFHVDSADDSMCCQPGRIYDGCAALSNSPQLCT